MKPHKNNEPPAEPIDASKSVKLSRRARSLPQGVRIPKTVNVSGSEKRIFRDEWKNIAPVNTLDGRTYRPKTRWVESHKTGGEYFTGNVQEVKRKYYPRKNQEIVFSHIHTGKSATLKNAKVVDIFERNGVLYGWLRIHGRNFTVSHLYKKVWACNIE